MYKKLTDEGSSVRNGEQLRELMRADLAYKKQRALMIYRPVVFDFIEQMNLEASWVLAGEKLNRFAHSNAQPGSLVSSLLDLTNYRQEDLLIKSFDIIFRLYNSSTNLFTEARNVMLLTTDDSRKFATRIERDFPSIRRLGSGFIEESSAKYESVA